MPLLRPTATTHPGNLAEGPRIERRKIGGLGNGTRSRRRSAPRSQAAPHNHKEKADDPTGRDAAIYPVGRNLVVGARGDRGGAAAIGRRAGGHGLWVCAVKQQRLSLHEKLLGNVQRTMAIRPEHTIFNALLAWVQDFVTSTKIALDRAKDYEESDEGRTGAAALHRVERLVSSLLE